MKEEQNTRKPYIDEEQLRDCEVIYNPELKHWYWITYAIMPDMIPTRVGPVRLESLTQRQKVDSFVRFNVEHFTSYDIHFMKDSCGLIGIFIMVQTASEMGSVYRTDRGGFGYKSARLYFDSYSKPLAGAVHFIVTEYKTGEWGLFVIGGHTDPIYFISDYTEFLDRKGIIKGCRSEEEVLEAFKAKPYGFDLKESKRFLRYDINEYLR